MYDSISLGVLNVICVLMFGFCYSVIDFEFCKVVELNDIFLVMFGFGNFVDIFLFLKYVFFDLGNI